MEKRRLFIVLGIGLILTCLTAYGALKLQSPYFASWEFGDFYRGMGGEIGTCELEKIRLTCPMILLGNTSKTVTVSLSNPEEYAYPDEPTYEYSITIYAITPVLEQGGYSYYADDVCSGVLIVPPGQTERFTCELNPKSAKGRVMSVHASARSVDKGCGGIRASCGVQAYYWLYCLLPFVVAAPFVWWLNKNRKVLKPE
jgi:hypothetical protein